MIKLDKLKFWKTKTSTKTNGSGSGTEKIILKPLPLIGHLPVAKQYIVAGLVMVVSIGVASGITVYGNNKLDYLAEHEVQVSALSKELESYSTQLRKISAGQDVYFPVMFTTQRRIVDLFDFLRVTTIKEFDELKGAPRVALEEAYRPWSAAVNLTDELQNSHVAVLTIRARLAATDGELKKSVDAVVEKIKDKHPSQADALLSALKGLQAVAGEAPINVSAGKKDSTPSARYKVNSEKLLEVLGSIPLDNESDDLKKLIPETSKKLTEMFTVTNNIFKYINAESVVKADNTTELVGFKSLAQDMLSKTESVSLELVNVFASIEDERKNIKFLFIFEAFIILLALSGLLLFFKIANNDSKKRALDAQAEADVVKESIIKLLDEISEVAEGNLTVTATVSETFTGAIADSINFMVSELKKVITNIIQSVDKVEESSEQAIDVAMQMSTGSRLQFERLAETGENIAKMSLRMSEVVDNTRETADLAKQSLEVSERGKEVVVQSIEKMNSIRNIIQDTSKKIKLLGESSTSIGEVTGLIRDITKQIDILALNAAIQAASAGEAGRGFAVVAQEVQRLALSSTEAAKKIDEMVLTIQADAKVAVASMEISTREVVEGAKLTDLAGTALKEIGDSVSKVTRSIEEVSTQIDSEAEEATNISMEMRSLQESTEEAVAQSEKSVEAVAEVKSVAGALKDSVKDFTV